VKLLVISQFFPYPPINGGRQRAYHLLKGLARRHDIHLLTFAQDQSDLSHIGDLAEFSAEVQVVPEKPFSPNPLLSLRGALSTKPKSVIGCWSSDMAGLVRDQIARTHFDAAIALTTKAGIYLSRHSLPKILDNDNIDSAYLARIVEFTDEPVTKFRRKLAWVKGKRHQRRLAASFDAVTAVSEEDRQELARLIPAAVTRGAIEVVPNGVDFSLLAFHPSRIDSKRVVSTGALTYPANLDAAVFFCEHILPSIRANVRDVTFVQTGSYDGVDTKVVLDAGAALTGFIEDIRPLVSESAALVVPLRIGGGTRLKILESMALGTPVVSTTLGAAGLGLIHERTAMLADDPQEFAACTVRLMRSEQLRETIAENAREYVSQNFGWDRSVEAMERVLHSVSGPQRT
jgi:polysaccharide biosynthesis protein PslH